MFCDANCKSKFVKVYDQMWNGEHSLYREASRIKDKEELTDEEKQIVSQYKTYSRNVIKLDTTKYDDSKNLFDN